MSRAVLDWAPAAIWRAWHDDCFVAMHRPAEVESNDANLYAYSGCWALRSAAYVGAASVNDESTSPAPGSASVTPRNVSSGSPFERRIGFSRAVRIGNLVAVSGTAPLLPDGTTACPGDVYGQTKRCLEIVSSALREAGAQMSDVIRTRVMLVDAKEWLAASRAHGEFFSGIDPACTFVEVSGFIDESWLVEIEADCVVGREFSAS